MFSATTGFYSRRVQMAGVVLGLFLPFSGTVVAQAPNPTQRQVSGATNNDQPIAVFKVDVVSHTMAAVNYRHREGSTMIDFQGTALLPAAKGDAKVDSKTGTTKIDAHFSKLVPAATFGPEFVTYVLWAITPEGRATNLGEVFLDGTNSSISAASDLQAFGLMVTAEPYFAVTQPSDAVVMENVIRKDTSGTLEQVNAKFELIQRGVYTRNMSAMNVAKMKLDKRVPLDLQEARNAVMIAQNMGADRYAGDTIAKAKTELLNAEGYLTSKGDKKALQTVARQATQMAEDARLITLRKMDDETRAAQAASEQKAKEDAAASDAARLQAEQLTKRAQEEKSAAETATAAAQKEKASADAARAAAEAARAAALEQQKKLEAETASAHAATDEANRLRDQAERDKAALREQIRTQLNLILETRDSARGLIVNMSDVLFDTGKFTLRAGTKEKLAKVSGILLAHPGLKLEVEGHTDSVGSDDFNQTLSDKRAGTVREYLISQGIGPESVTATGFGKTMPIATNDTAEGRQKNRRVELVVSGEPIMGPLSTNVR